MCTRIRRGRVSPTFCRVYYCLFILDCDVRICVAFNHSQTQSPPNALCHSTNTLRARARFMWTPRNIKGRDRYSHKSCGIESDIYLRDTSHQCLNIYIVARDVCYRTPHPQNTPKSVSFNVATRTALGILICPAPAAHTLHSISMRGSRTYLCDYLKWVPQHKCDER